MQYTEFMTITEQKRAAKAFAERWKDRGYEKGDSQPFWLDFLEHVLGIETPSTFIRFEDVIKLDTSNGFIDGYIDETNILIEQKSIEKDLRKPIKQSDGSFLNSFQQAKRYSAELPYDKRPRWIITCNFKSFLIYDMNTPNGEPEEILLSELEKEYYRFAFLTNKKANYLRKEDELSFKAGELVGELYDALAKEYQDIDNEQSQKDLNELCVRLVFCLYAEDAGLFGRKNIFHDYLAKHQSLSALRRALIDLFLTLDTPEEGRDPYLDEDLAQFPYVNGGLFSHVDLEIPRFTPEIREILLDHASDEFDWSGISPTIFGAVFESTLNPETRHAGGMHYTSTENIHKVIDPLFINELRSMLDEAQAVKNDKSRKKKLEEFQSHLATLKFLDPAAGSGNFLTESYLALRRLENEAILLMNDGQMIFDMNDPIKVSISQFYGIEINDFAVKVAKAALWIAEAQMFEETQALIGSNKDISDFLPLESYDNIYEGNALRVDWNDILPASECSYIMGNPPFLGFTYMSKEQKKDMSALFPGVKNLDYVCAWYKKANDFISNSKIEVAFVSTNSITQGETVPRFWKFIDFNINFAYRTFKWDSEANDKAAVHCVIIGFAQFDREQKMIIDERGYKACKNINAYLMNTEDILIESRTNPICNVPQMVYGNKPVDGGNLILEEDERSELLAKNPSADKFIKPLIGAREYIQNKKRWCIWLVGVSPSEIKQYPIIMERIERVRNMRLNSVASAIQKFAATPTLFAQITQPEGKDYIIVPCTSSENRKYIPIGFLTNESIVTNAVQIVPNANLYHLGVLTSNVHMAWMRAFSGKLKSDYRYSKDVVYNTFPWPNPSDEQKALIAKTAQAILDARALYPESSLADLYNELTMPPELRTAHQENDRAVLKAYGLNWRGSQTSEADCVAALMEMYQALVAKTSISRR